MLRKIFGWMFAITGGLMLLAAVCLLVSPEGRQAGKDALWLAVLPLFCGWFLLRRKNKTEPPHAPAAGGKKQKPGSYTTRDCPYCDERMPLDAKFCPSCGRKMKSEDSTCGTGSGISAKEARSSFAAERRQAKALGSEYYIWRTCGDGAVCERCRLNDGQKFSWDVEPKGGHAGARARCRCYPEAVIPK